MANRENIVPTAPNVGTVGRADKPWKDVYAEKFHGKMADKRTIDGVEFDASGNIHHYTVCNTDADVADKTVDMTGFVLATGARITVSFANDNTADNPTLDVNNTGAVAIYTDNAPIPAYLLTAGQPFEFVYDGTYWQITGGLAGAGGQQTLIISDTEPTNKEAIWLKTPPGAVVPQELKIRKIVTGATPPTDPNALWLKTEANA